MNFKDRVIRYVKSIPKAKVASYGQVAAAAGSPRAARQVGGILRALGPDSGVPWWRVINRDGVISIKGNWLADKKLQGKLLVKEGVEVSQEFTVDIHKYRVSVGSKK